MGWFSKKKVEIGRSDGSRLQIDERLFNQWVAEGKIHRADCQVHILDPKLSEPRLETWTIGKGKEVDLETYDRSKDENGDLYMLVVYDGGQPSQYFVAKDMWEKTKRDVFSTPPPASSSLEEQFDYLHKKLLSLGFEAQAVAGGAMNIAWRVWHSKYPTLESFRDAEEVEKAEYLRKMGEVIDKLASDEFAQKDNAPQGTSLGTLLAFSYLTAVARNDAAMVARIADAMEPFSKMAIDIRAQRASN